ncbi:2-dehydro-3-deoxyglucarate aldolase [Ktedonosporobacter rubrisoli]|uniref:2-dehydro-3-deoxyglucarate aldolase n=1 Tax=Ktedonosporobacter rubrisoli TaxID=2509675 RepID=A0A4P6JRA9_KTERU|nr:aldolase/citrate lyase family protein [Ktedonosporobacter rubrisoli]QBD77978.1 2-dehydro-3-deoxyglucarate aldolase [Ktedonosporobacter rubrisoli]
MRTNHVKEKLKRGEPVLGAWLSLPSLPTARIMARLDFDWLLVDMEHSAQTPTQMADMVGAIADAGTCAPFVRIPYNSVEWYKWALDAGAWGVMAPMVSTREEAQQAVSHSKYPPQGSRSIGGIFAPYGFGLTSWSDYAQEANDEILVIVQIESASALANLDEILSVPGIDVAFVGPNDLHAQIGLPPSVDGAEPEFLAALERIKVGAKKYNVAPGIFCGTGESAAQRLSQGFQMVPVTTDINSLITAANQNLRIARG